MEAGADAGSWRLERAAVARELMRRLGRVKDELNCLRRLAIPGRPRRFAPYRPAQRAVERLLRRGARRSLAEVTLHLCGLAGG